MEAAEAQLHARKFGLRCSQESRPRSLNRTTCRSGASRTAPKDYRSLQKLLRSLTLDRLIPSIIAGQHILQSHSEHMETGELVPGAELPRQWDYLLVLLSYVCRTLLMMRRRTTRNKTRILFQGLSVFGAWTAFAMVEQGKLALQKGSRPTLWSVSAGVALGGW